MTNKPPYYSLPLLYNLQQGRCFYCGTALVQMGWTNEVRKGYTRDHFFPKAMGNTLTRNTVLSCGKCNRKKGDYLPTREEVIRFHELWSQIHGGTIFDLSEFLHTQKLIDILEKIIGVRVDTKTII